MNKTLKRDGKEVRREQIKNLGNTSALRVEASSALCYVPVPRPGTQEELKKYWLMWNHFSRSKPQPVSLAFTCQRSGRLLRSFVRSFSKQHVGCALRHYITHTMKYVMHFVLCQTPQRRNANSSILLLSDQGTGMKRKVPYLMTAGIGLCSLFREAEFLPRRLGQRSLKQLVLQFLSRR